MAGCFGNHPVDRWMERQLDDYLSQFDDEDYVAGCEECGHIIKEESELNELETEQEEERIWYICPNCGSILDTEF